MKYLSYLFYPICTWGATYLLLHIKYKNWHFWLTICIVNRRSMLLPFCLCYSSFCEIQSKVGFASAWKAVLEIPSSTLSWFSLLPCQYLGLCALDITWNSVKLLDMTDSIFEAPFSFLTNELLTRPEVAIILQAVTHKFQHNNWNLNCQSVGMNFMKTEEFTSAY